MPKPGKKFEQKQVDQHLAELNKSAVQNLLDDAFGNGMRSETKTGLSPYSTARIILSSMGAPAQNF